MEGYKRSTLKLTFTDPDFTGLEIKARRLTIGVATSLIQLQTLDLTMANADKIINGLAEQVGPFLLAWNLLDDQDQPVPAGVAGLQSMDLPMLQAVLSALAEASMGVPPPLPGDSNSGNRSLEELIPMMDLFSGNPVS